MSEITSKEVGVKASAILKGAAGLQDQLIAFIDHAKSVAGSALTQLEPRSEDVVITMDTQELMKLIQALPRPEFREAMKALQQGKNIRFITITSEENSDANE